MLSLRSNDLFIQINVQLKDKHKDKKLKIMNNKHNKIEIKKVLHLNDNNTPLLFNKKSHKIINKPLVHIRIDTGITRHFTPAAQEWFNSIYAYNKNYIKTLPIADKTLMNLLKTYFNSILKPKFLTTAKPSPSKKKIKRGQKIKVIPIRIRRVSTKRVFVGKGDLKHTNNKIILTFYIYSTEGMVLSHTYKALTQGLFHPRNALEKTITWSRAGKKITTYNRIFSLYEFLVLRNHYYWYLTFITSLITRLNNTLDKVNLYYEDLKSLVEINILTENEKDLMFNDKVDTFNCLTYPDYSAYLNKIESNYIKEWHKYIYLLNTYKLKFTSNYISKLNTLVNGIYNKKVIFNIVNLKKIHLNSDIFTQAVALKLRNKDNKIYRVLKSSLRKINIKPISKIKERRLGRRDKNLFLVNRVRNNLISSMLINDKVKSTPTDLLLDFFYTPINWLDDNIIELLSRYSSSEGLKEYVFKKLKHMKLRGIKIEAKGRLTRRATASRSVFKMRWKGGLKNIDSSFRGWSAIMLRGIAKSNVQYSVTSSKNPNGAYGVKGWVSNK